MTATATYTPPAWSDPKSPGHPRVRWGSEDKTYYRVLRLNERGQPSQLPGDFVFIEGKERVTESGAEGSDSSADNHSPGQQVQTGRGQVSQDAGGPQPDEVFTEEQERKNEKSQDNQEQQPVETQVIPVMDDSCKDILILGERSGGICDFLNWWQQELNNAKHPWVLASGSAWDEEFFGQSRNPKSPEKVADALTALDRFGWAKTVTERAKILTKLGKKLDGPFTVILHQLSALGGQADPRSTKAPEPSAGQQAAEALAIVRESGRCPDLRLLVADDSETIYQTTRIVPGYIRFCHVFRLAPLDKDAIWALATRTEPGWQPLTLSDQIVMGVIEHTGGQPLLVQHLLRRLQHELGAGAGRVDKADLERAARNMYAAPPVQVEVWKSDLRRLLAEQPDLRQVIATYAAGGILDQMRFPPPSEERPLYIAGWVGLDQTTLESKNRKRWGIASRLHQALARSVLDENKGGKHE